MSAFIRVTKAYNGVVVHVAIRHIAAVGPIYSEDQGEIGWIDVASSQQEFVVKETTAEIMALIAEASP